MSPEFAVIIVIILLLAYVVMQVVRMKRSFEGRGGTYENFITWAKGFLPEMLR